MYTVHVYDTSTPPPFLRVGACHSRSRSGAIWLASALADRGYGVVVENMRNRVIECEYFPHTPGACQLTAGPLQLEGG